MSRKYWILPFDTACGVDHEYAYVGVFDGARISRMTGSIRCLRLLSLFAYAGGIDDIEVESEFIVTGIYRVASRSGYIGNNVSVFADAALIIDDFPALGRPTTAIREYFL